MSDKKITTFMSEKCGLYEKVAMKGCVCVLRIYEKNNCGFVISVITNNQGFGKCYDSLIIQYTTKTECNVLKKITANTPSHGTSILTSLMKIMRNLQISPITV